MERPGKLLILSIVSLCIFTIQCAQEKSPLEQTAGKNIKPSSSTVRISKPETASAETRKKVWLIGMDGATWHVALPLLLNERESD